MSLQDIAVVTGGAGLIGSHIVDDLLQKGYHVRVIDNLHPQTHKHGKPSWISKEVEFISLFKNHHYFWSYASRKLKYK